MRDDFKIRARRTEFFRDGVSIHIFRRADARHFEAVTKLEVETFDEGMIGPQSPLEISHDQAQQLIDALWDCGLRPSEGAGSAGAMKAAQDHLKDLQTALWRS